MEGPCPLNLRAACNGITARDFLCCSTQFYWVFFNTYYVCGPRITRSLPPWCDRARTCFLTHSPLLRRLPDPVRAQLPKSVPIHFPELLLSTLLVTLHLRIYLHNLTSSFDIVA